MKFEMSQRIVQFCLLMHGIGILLPWNMFITAKEYFTDFKLVQEPHYVTNFLSFMGLASQIPNILFAWLNIYLGHLGGGGKKSVGLERRMLWSILLQVVIFIVTLALASVDSSTWTGAFFWITMFSVLIINMAGGIYQNTTYGIAAKFPFKYTATVVIGSNLSGLFTSLAAIASSLIAVDASLAAIYYFSAAIFALMVCLASYVIMIRNRFYRRCTGSTSNDQDDEGGAADLSRPEYWKVFKGSARQLFNVFFTFFVSLSIFPSIHSDIASSNGSDNFLGNQFVNVTCFLSFNLFAMLGSWLASHYQKTGPKNLTWLVVARIIFIPLFLFCNYQPKNVVRTVPVLIKEDWIYWPIAILMALSSGYTSSLAMMYSSRSVQDSATAGMFAAAMLVTGIFCGLAFSMALSMLVQI